MQQVSRPVQSLGARVRVPAPAAPSIEGAAVKLKSSNTAGVVSTNGPVFYVIQVRMKGSSYGGVVFLQHYRWFNQEQLDRMIAEAVEITEKVRIGNRRKDLSSRAARIDDAKQTNEALFKTDLDFFETVMSDKFEFEIVRANVCRAEIEPTIKGI
jgi:hypothetical protein